jgi:hypothetical protein
MATVKLIERVDKSDGGYTLVEVEARENYGEDGVPYGGKVSERAVSILLETIALMKGEADWQTPEKDEFESLFDGVVRLETFHAWAWRMDKGSPVVALWHEEFGQYPQATVYGNNRHPHEWTVKDLQMGGYLPQSIGTMPQVAATRRDMVVYSATSDGKATQWADGVVVFDPPLQAYVVESETETGSKRKRFIAPVGEKVHDGPSPNQL